eukprot:12748562-Ditylum_brightwellii.AAC.1
MGPAEDKANNAVIPTSSNGIRVAAEARAAEKAESKSRNAVTTTCDGRVSVGGFDEGPWQGDQWLALAEVKD